MGRSGTIGVDFDGVIHWYRRGWRDGSIYDEPAPGAWDGLRALRDAGRAVFVFTARDVLQVQAWLVDNAPSDLCAFVADPASALGQGGARLGRFWDDRTRILVTNRKLPALAYIDDRAVRHVTWRDTLHELREDGLV